MRDNVAFYVDQLVERYDLGENLESLSKSDLNLIWTEIQTGLKMLQFDDFNQRELKRLMEMKPNNLAKLACLCNLVHGKNKHSGKIYGTIIVLPVQFL